MSRFHPARLGQLPTSIVMSEGFLSPERHEWAQPLDRWTVIYYGHANSVVLNGHTLVIEPTTMIFFPPGATCGHALTGEDTHMLSLTFDMPDATGERYAIPEMAPDMSRVLHDLTRAIQRISFTVIPARVFAWNLMWSVARSGATLRSNAEIYAAEDYVNRNLGRAIAIEEIANFVHLSSRQLLRLFREQHGVTVQEFIRQRRVRESTRLLMGTNLAVKEIAQRVGIQDLHYFNKMIRQGTGLSPRAFRELARRKDEII